MASIFYKWIKIIIVNPWCHIIICLTSINIVDEDKEREWKRKQLILSAIYRNTFFRKNSILFGANLSELLILCKSKK